MELLVLCTGRGVPKTEIDGGGGGNEVKQSSSVVREC